MAELERMLSQLGRELDWPDTPELAPGVRARLAEPSPRRARRPLVGGNAPFAGPRPGARPGAGRGRGRGDPHRARCRRSSSSGSRGRPSSEWPRSPRRRPSVRSTSVGARRSRPRAGTRLRAAPAHRPGRARRRLPPPARGRRGAVAGLPRAAGPAARPQHAPRTADERVPGRSPSRLRRQGRGPGRRGGAAGGGRQPRHLGRGRASLLLLPRPGRADDRERASPGRQRAAGAAGGSAGPTRRCVQPRAGDPRSPARFASAPCPPRAGAAVSGTRRRRTPRPRRFPPRRPSWSGRAHR